MNERIIFLGTPKISAIVLEGLIEAGFDIIGVITKEDKVRGRGNRIECSEVAKVAARYGIPVFKPHRLNQDYQFIIDLKPDLLLTFAYGQIIKEDILHLSRFKPLNLHASLLPKYRGAAPIQYALRNGDTETGVCLMEMIKEMDAGDIYARKKIEISPTDDYSSLSMKIADLSLSLAIENLPLYFAGRLTPSSQDPSQVSFAPSIKKEEEHLILNQSPVQFVNQVRSLSEQPGGYLYLDGEILKIYESISLSDEVSSETGTIIRAEKDQIILQLGSGTVGLKRLQRPGKRIMSARDFNNGYRIEGKVLR